MATARRLRAPLLITTAILLPLLVGCAADRPPITGSPDPSGSPAPTGSSDPSASPTPSDAPGRPIAIDCTELISLQTMYDYNPNFLLVPSHTPDPDSGASTAVGYNGLDCAWQNTSSGDIISIAVADLPADVLDKVRSAASAEGTEVSAFGSAGYFSTSNDTGRADAFTGSYWIVAESSWFLSASDAAPLVTAALDSLGG